MQDTDSGGVQQNDTPKPGLLQFPTKAMLKMPPLEFKIKTDTDASQSAAAQSTNSHASTAKLSHSSPPPPPHITRTSPSPAASRSPGQGQHTPSRSPSSQQQHTPSPSVTSQGQPGSTALTRQSPAAAASTASAHGDDALFSPPRKLTLKLNTAATGSRCAFSHPNAFVCKRQILFFLNIVKLYVLHN